MLITTAHLKRANVCMGYRRKFRARFPNGRVRITQRGCEDRAQVWPWRIMAEKFLNAAGLAEFRKAESVIDNIRITPKELWRDDTALSDRAKRAALASVFGRLAEQKRFDPAYTP